MILLTILVFIIILGLLIFVHEAGHFIVAKRAGMKVEEFGFGFPPRLFGIRRGETVYSINWIPLGGFVKILGEDGDEFFDPRSFGNGTFGRRLAVLVAGVGMNFILGWFLLFLGFAVVGTPVEIEQGADLAGARLSRTQTTVVGIEPGSPAEYAGFKHGDAILSVDGNKFSNIDELVAYNQSRAGSKVTYELKRGKDIINRDVFPRVNPPDGSDPVGFAPATVGVATYPLGQALQLSVSAFFDRAVGIVSAFALLTKKLFTSGKLIEGLSGPVGIAVLTRDILVLGLVYLTQFAAVLSINLGVINAFPFPALDGGRVLFLLIEKVRGAKSLKFEKMANAAGFVLLLLLMAAVTLRDFDRYSEGFKRLFERIL